MTIYLHPKTFYPPVATSLKPNIANIHQVGSSSIEAFHNYTHVIAYSRKEHADLALKKMFSLATKKHLKNESFPVQIFPKVQDVHINNIKYYGIYAKTRTPSAILSNFIVAYGDTTHQASQPSVQPKVG